MTTNITAEVWAVADRRPQDVAVRSTRLTLTYAELREASSRVAGQLDAAGVRAGDRLVLVCPTVPEFAIVYYAMHAVGAVVIPMNTMATQAEIQYVLQDSEARLVLAWHECSGAATAAAAEHGVPLWELEPNAGVAAALSGAKPLALSVGRDRQDSAVILYTSGTTGSPKGAELTTNNLIETARAITTMLDVTPQDRFGTALPLFHCFGQAVLMNTVLINGASLSLLERFTPGALLEMVRDHELTVLMGVPTMWNAMLHTSDDFGPGDFTSLRLAVSGGASLPVDVFRAFKERFSCAILEGYGLTETSGVATFNDLHRAAKPGTVGVPLPGAAVEVRSPEGRALGPGDVGEVFVAGPMVMKGYWGRPETTAAELQEGWLKTGDLGTLDEQGYLSIVGRAKELIIRGGYNVYPREVEDVLYEHPDLVEVAVIGIPDPYYGEEVVAVCTVRVGATASREELRQWAKTRLSAYKVPHLFHFVESLPKGSTGKILKRAIDVDAVLTDRARGASQLG